MARLLRTVAAGLLSVVVVSATATIPTNYDVENLTPWYVYENPYSTSTTYGGLSVSQTFTGDAVGTGKYNRSHASVGWDYLSIDGRGGFSSGFLEGYLTAEVVLEQGVQPMPDGAVGAWIKEHVAFMQSMSASATDDPFWQQVGQRLEYMAGMAEGVNQATNGSSSLSMMDIFLNNFIPFELDDVQMAVQVQQGKQVESQTPVRGHCSALIKVTADDLFAAHDTWASYSFMARRIFKKYSFGDNTVTFSSHPSLIASGDDWYQTAHGLSVMETTNGVYNHSLYTAVVPQTVSEFLRAAVATQLATTGEQWTELFSLYNSGTYNNQYMVVNFNLYAPGSSIAPGTLWVLEQLPGYIHRGDQSAVLASQGYWSSYNIPFYQDIYALSGTLAQCELYGDFFNYTKYARHEIFARNQSDVTDVASMMRVMRYNNYQVDPLSKIQNCSGAPNNQCETPQSSMLSIASRGDLMTVYPTTQQNIDHYGPLYAYEAQGCFGAVDSKIASWKNRWSLDAWMIAGPTNDEVPTFDWSTAKGCEMLAPSPNATVVDFPWVAFHNVGPASWATF